MLHEVVSVRHPGGHRLRVRFADGVEGVVDLAEIVPFEGVFEPLRDPGVVAQVAVSLGTVVWPSGADLDPDVLHARVTGRPVSVGG